MIGLLLCLFVSGVSAQPESPAYFGVVNGYTHPADMRALGAGWQRITFDWSLIQPDGPRDFELVDPAWIQGSTRDDREIVGLIVHTPAWASESGEPNAVPAGLDLPLDDPHNSWARFITRLVTTYAPRGIHHWIIYDEPDVRLGEGPVSFAGEVADYALLLQTASLAAKAVDPDAVIHVAGMNWWTDVAAGREPYLARLLRLLAADPDAAANGYYFDVVTLHISSETQALWDVIAANQSILESAQVAGKAIWLETNAPPTVEPGSDRADSLFSITPVMQADFIVQAAAIALVKGVNRIGIDRLADVPGEFPPLGLIAEDGTRRPAFTAFQRVIDLFAETTASEHFSNRYAELIVLDQPDKQVMVMWARENTPLQFVVTTGQVGQSAPLYDSQGDVQEIVSESYDYPAAFTIDVPPAQPDDKGFMTVAGSPRILVLDQEDDFFHVVYVLIAGERFRLK
jgi:hypothetical protein